MKTLEPKHVLRQLCTFFGSGNHTVDDACFMMMLISFDPSVYFFRFTMLLDVGPRVRVLMSSLLPCYYASGHAPHLQLISFFPPTSLQDWAAEPVGNVHGVAQVNEEEQEGEQWVRARVPTGWRQSGAGRYGTQAFFFGRWSLAYQDTSFEHGPTV